MRDDTHYSVDGRGVDLTGLFEGLASSCIEACLSMDHMGFLYDDVYEHFYSTGIQGMFVSILEPYIFDLRVREVPPNIIQALIRIHDDRGEYGQAEAVIWHVDPMSLDINQAVTLCQARGLWDALIHVYTRAMNDFVAPIVELSALILRVQHSRLNETCLVSEEVEEDPENLELDAYKMYAYIEYTLSGLSYPSGESLLDNKGVRARSEVYGFLFSSRPIIWPEGDGDLIIASDDDDALYPYLLLLLRFDAEAFLHTMDIAFEDPFLNDGRGAISRQSIVNVMLELKEADRFTPGDVTLLHIFVARNLPKYPQFLSISPTRLHEILVSLATDRDPSTHEDRQLAAEYLLSAYTPHDAEAMLSLFEQSGFYRILQATYRKDRKWALLINTFVKDTDAHEEIFANIDEIIQVSASSSGVSEEVFTAVGDALSHLINLSVQQTASLLDKGLPSLHDRAIAKLSGSDHEQMAYLRCLLEPSIDDQDEKGPIPFRLTPSTNLNIPARHRYVTLLCRNRPDTVINFLDVSKPSSFDLPRLADECETIEFYEGQLWALDRQGKTTETFDMVGDVLRSQGAHLSQDIVGRNDEAMHKTIQSLQSVSRMAVRLCREHSAARTEHAEDMWYGVLHEMVDLVHSVAALASLDLREPNTEVSSDDLAVESVRSLVRETLQSLVSLSSQSLSFPRLFKRLVEASTPTSKAEKGRAYSEFRAILTGMLDSYRAEGDMLSMTTRLVEADLFMAIQEMAEKRQRGWRAAMNMCDVCGKAISSPNGRETRVDSETRERSESLQILGSGRVLHESCSVSPP